MDNVNHQQNQVQIREKETAKNVTHNGEKIELNQENVLIGSKQLSFDRKQLQSAPASTNKSTFQTFQTTIGFAKNQRPKTAVVKESKSNTHKVLKKSISGASNRPQTTGNRVFASSMTNMSEKEQKFVVKRMQCRSAQMKRVYVESRDNLADQSHRRRAKSAAVRSESRNKLMSLVVDSRGSHVRHEKEMKRLMADVCRDYYKQLKIDVRSFIVDTYSVE